MSNIKKNFFKTKTRTQMLKNATNVTEISSKNDLAEFIDQKMTQTDVAIINKTILSEELEQKLRLNATLEIPIKDGTGKIINELPHKLRKEQIELANELNQPFIAIRFGNKLIYLDAIASGAMIYSYGNLFKDKNANPKIIQPYISFDSAYELTANKKFIPPFDAKARIGINGAVFNLRLPSLESAPRYEIKHSGVPIIDDESKFELAYTIESDHACKYTKNTVKFPKPHLGKFPKIWDQHDVAADLAIIDFAINPADWNFDLPKSTVPLQMHTYGIITKELAEYYDKLNHNVFMQTDKKIRHLNMNEKNKLIYLRIQALGDKANLFASGSKVRDYAWRGRESYLKKE